MKISAFTIVRNALNLHYPLEASIRSVLPICDEFIVNVGQGDDGTLDLVKSINSPKIKIIETQWDFSKKEQVLSQQTNVALKHCTGTWAFYIQADEVIHEEDLPKIVTAMKKFEHDPHVDALRFWWFHFYGSYYRYRIDKGWYQKQDRIIRNNGSIESFGDAFAFRRKDGKPLKVKNTNSFVYHYGWVFTPEVMAQRRINSGQIWQHDRTKEQATGRYEFGDLHRFPIYFGRHPKVMDQLINTHQASQEDAAYIRRKHWFNPLWVFHIRYKTGRRVSQTLV